MIDFDVNGIFYKQIEKGRAFSFGNNTDGQLGVQVPQSTEFLLIPALSGKIVSKISAGGRHSLAVVWRKINVFDFCQKKKKKKRKITNRNIFFWKKKMQVGTDLWSWGIIDL